MNVQNAKEYLPLVQALANGKTIQCNDRGEWLDVEDLNTDSYDPVVPLHCRFERVGGRMYPVVDDLAIAENAEWEHVTVMEVLQ